MKLIHCKKRFSIKDLVTFTKETINGKIHFLCSDTILQMLLIQIALDLEVPMNHVMIKDLVLVLFPDF